MKKYSLIFIGFLMISSFTKAETYNLDLQQSIAIAKEKSFSMLNLEKDFKIAEYNLKEAKSRLKTHIDLNFVLPQYSQEIKEFRTSSSVTYYSSKTLDYRTYLTISQPLPTDGLLYVRTGIGNENDYNLNVSTPNLYTTFGFTQPLQSIYGYNKIKSTLKLAELNYERSKKELKREELNLIYQVSSSFYNLLYEQKGTEISRANLDRQKEAYDISQSKYTAGLIKEVDALQMEVDLAEAQNNYDLAIVSLANSHNGFKQLLGINFSDSVIINNEFKYSIVIIDPDMAVKLALENRLEIREQEISIEQSKLNVKKEKSNGMIQSAIDLSYGNNGVYKQPINSTISSSINNVYNTYLNSPAFGIGLTVRVPILDFGENKARVNAAKTSLEKVILLKTEVERGIEREVRNLVANLNSSLKRLQLLEKNVIVAEKSFEITRQRFSDGDIDSQALALELNRLNTAYNNHLRSYIDYQLMLSDITRKTFYDFKKNEVIK